MRRRVASRTALVRLIPAVWALLVGGLGAADAPPAELVTLRIVHLSPDAPLVDVLIDGRAAVRDLPFAHRSIPLLLPAGRHEVRVFPHRPSRRQLTAPLDDAAPLGDAAAPPPRRAQPLEPVAAVFDLPAGTTTTLVLTGFYTPPAAAERRGHISLQVQPPDAEITLEGPHGYRATFLGDQFLVGLEPGPYQAEARRSGYGAAVYEIDVAPDTTSIVAITLQEADAGEERATVPDAGTPGVAPAAREAAWRALELQPYQDERVPLAAPGQAWVRFVQVAPTVAPLDVRAWLAADDDAGSGPGGGAADPSDEGAGELLGIDALSYPNASDYHSVPARPVRLELRVAGTPSVVLAVDDLVWSPGATYTVFVIVDPLTNVVWLVPIVDAAVPQTWAPVAAGGGTR